MVEVQGEVVGNQDAETYDVQTLWLEYERVAMHFNDLLMRLRTQSLGGLAAVGTIASFLIKDSLESPDRYGYLAGLMLALLVAWVALARLDLTYYDKMLIGAVHAIHRLEEASQKGKRIDQINLSWSITDAVENRLPGITNSSWLTGRRFYYAAIAVLLSMFCVVFVVMALCSTFNVPR